MTELFIWKASNLEQIGYDDLAAFVVIAENPTDAMEVYWREDQDVTDPDFMNLSEATIKTILHDCVLYSRPLPDHLLEAWNKKYAERDWTPTRWNIECIGRPLDGATKSLVLVDQRMG